MNKEEKKELITEVTICSFLFLAMIMSTVYYFVQKEYLVVCAAIIAMILASAQFVGGPVAYYRERFQKMKQEKNVK
ncbi:MAG: hypothetical protein HY005_01105 [Candidatus Staskawiczbacteria bacterium]|nr:hypothetical protein [Candidatus Staskawiczbacteria bacterium]MBI3337204.1 hypothetical protein [Candidatus Staskawiczbacteria bacterium]